jgi:hypothetical protein
MGLIHHLSKSGGRVFLLICALLLLAAREAAGAGTQTSATGAAAFHATLKTTDGQFVLRFGVTPNRLGLNVFTVNVQDASSRQPASPMQVRLSTTMLDMDMGTDQVNLQSDGHGQYSAQGTLSMSGHWDIRVLLHTSDGALHQASVEFVTS